MIRRIFGRITEFLSTASNALTRRVRVTSRKVRRSLWRATHDWSRPDYEFWRKAYRCQARGLELSGLFIKPLVNKVAAWTLGRAPHFDLENEASQQALDNWWRENHSDVLRAWRSALKQGDSFLVINSDLSVTLVPPDLVEPMVAEDDYTDITGWRITQVVPHPTRTADRMAVVDEYTTEGRTRRVEINGRVQQETTFPNLIGRLPVVHIPDQPEDGQTFGHPEAEALVEIFQRYGITLEAGVEGNELQGRPTPVLSFESRDDLDRFWELYGVSKTHELPDGTTETYEVLEVDLNQLLTVSGAEFSYESPGQFVQDTERLLGLMFYLILEHTELPEFVFGNAIASSKASAETQMPVFIRFIEMRRGEMVGWLTAIAEVVLGYLSLMQPGVAAQTPRLQWEALDQDDGKLTLETIIWAYAEGLLDERTALTLAPVEIEDIETVLAQARQEREERFPEETEPPDDVIQRLFRGEIEAQENV